MRDACDLVNTDTMTMTTLVQCYNQKPLTTLVQSEASMARRRRTPRPPCGNGQSGCKPCKEGYCNEGSINPISCEIGAQLLNAEIIEDAVASATQRACVSSPTHV